MGRAVFGNLLFVIALCFSLLFFQGCGASIQRTPAEISAQQETTGSRSTAKPPPAQIKFPQVGRASWYGPQHQGQRTASGEIFDQKLFTAAHRTLPFGTKLKVTNIANGKSVEVKVNDRGPFVEDRIIDLSHEAARILGIIEGGIATVRLELSSQQ